MGRLHLSDGLLRTSGGRLVLTDSQGGAPCCGCGSGPCSPDSFPDQVFIKVSGAAFCTSGTKAVRYSSEYEEAGDSNGLQPAYVVTTRHEVTPISGGLNRTHCLVRTFQGGGQAVYQAPQVVAEYRFRIRIDRDEVNPVPNPVRAIPGSDDFEIVSTWQPTLTLRCEELAAEPGKFVLVVDEGAPDLRRVFPIDATGGDGFNAETRGQHLASGRTEYTLVGVTYPADGANDNTGLIIDPSCPGPKGEIPPEEGCDIAFPCARTPIFPDAGTRCGGVPVGVGTFDRLITVNAGRQVGGADFAWNQGNLAESLADVFSAAPDPGCFATGQTEFYGRFLLGGSWRVDLEGDCPDPATVDPMGACCLPDGSCETTDEATCLAAGGEYGGDGTGCEEACGEPDPVGACCIDGECSQQTELDCAFAGGVYEGDGVPCSPNPCSPAVGACCGFDGTCTETTQADCFAGNGEYQGDGTLCADTFCRSTGACCAPAVGTNPARCIDFLTNEQCDFLRGVYFGNGSLCGSRDCSDGASIPIDPIFIDDEQQALSAGSFF